VASARWTLETARAILPDVRRRTEEAVARVDALTEQRATTKDPAARVELEQRIARAVSVWIRAMEALGVRVKGAWGVDFETGDGSYCWRWPEERLDYFEARGQDFAGRLRIQ